jgi:acyl carrier protein
MADSERLDSRIESIVADRLRVDADAFDESTPFDGPTLDAESLDVVEIAEAIEADVGVHVPDEALSNIDTVGDLREYVAERV